MGLKDLMNFDMLGELGKQTAEAAEKAGYVTERDLFYGAIMLYATDGGEPKLDTQRAVAFALEARQAKQMLDELNEMTAGDVNGMQEVSD